MGPRSVCAEERKGLNKRWVRKSAFGLSSIPTLKRDSNDLLLSFIILVCKVATITMLSDMKCLVCVGYSFLHGLPPGPITVSNSLSKRVPISPLLSGKGTRPPKVKGGICHDLGSCPGLKFTVQGSSSSQQGSEYFPFTPARTQVHGPFFFVHSRGFAKPLFLFAALLLSGFPGTKLATHCKPGHAIIL